MMFDEVQKIEIEKFTKKRKLIQKKYLFMTFFSFFGEIDFRLSFIYSSILKIKILVLDGLCDKEDGQRFLNY